MVLRSLGSATAVAAALLVATPSSAQNFRSVPLGGRTATMGGAGVANGTDAAMPYLNPAGIAGTPYDVFSLSADVYSYATASVDHYFVPTTLNPALGDLTIRRERLSASEFIQTPSSVAYFKRFGVDGDPLLHVLAFSINAVVHNDLGLDASFRADGPGGRLHIDYLAWQRHRTYLGGPSYALRIGQRVRLGVSAFASYSDVYSDVHDITLYSPIENGVESPRAVSNRTVFDYHSVGATLIAGAQAEILPRLWLGATAELFGLPIKSGGSYVQTTTATDVAVAPDGTRSQVAAQATTEGRFTRAGESRPMRFSLGAAYTAPEAFTLAADAHVYPARASFRSLELEGDVFQSQTGTPSLTSRRSAPFRYGTRTMVNFSIGSEVFLSKSTTLRGGFLTDFDAVERNPAVAGDRVDWYQLTLGLGRRDGDLETTYGVAYRLGAGVMQRLDELGPDPTAIRTINYRAHGVMLILSGAVRTN